MSEISMLFETVKEAKGLLCTFVPPKKGSAKAIGECVLYGHRFRLYGERRGSISYRYIPPGVASEEAEAARTGCHTPEEAFVFADAFLRERAKLFLRSGQPASEPIGMHQDTATIRDAFDYVRVHYRDGYTAKQWREILRIMLCAEQIWDLDRRYMSLSGRDITRYMMVRTEVGLVLPKSFSRRPTLAPCKNITAVNDLRMLSVLFTKLQEETDESTREMPFKVNPFSWLSIPGAEKALREKPTARRYEILMEYVDHVDPSGQLRLVLVIARWLGRRLNSIVQLQREELRLTKAEMASTIKTISKRGHAIRDGVQSVEFASAFVQGGIFFDRNRDKKGYQRLVPMSTLVRQEVDLYLTRHPELNPSGPLFPNDEDPRFPWPVIHFIELLHEAEEMAREDFEDEIPELYNSAFHGFRGLRASEMENNLHRAAHVNFIIGWSCRIGKVKDDRYVKHDPQLLYAAVEGLRPVEIQAEYQEARAALEEENASLRTQNSELNVRIQEMADQNSSLHQKLDRLTLLLERLTENGAVA